MKITEEWLKDQIEMSKDSIGFLESCTFTKIDSTAYKIFKEGQISALNKVLDRLNQSDES